MKFVFIVLLVLTLSCKNQKSLMLVDESQDNELTLLVQDGYFFTDAIETSVIKDEKTLKSFFSKVNKTRKPGIPIPKVDFSKEMVLVVCMGEQKTPGLPSLKVIKNSEKEKLIGVGLESIPNTSKKITSYPFCVYKLPLSEDKVIFQILQ